MSKRRTIREQFIAGLTVMGEKEVKRTRDYIVFSRKDEGIIKGWFYYLGNKGGLRTGISIKDSFPVSLAIRELILNQKGTD